MSQSTVIALVPEPHAGETEHKMSRIREGLQKGIVFDNMPFMDIENGRVVSHEGRHRAFALREMNAEWMPVLIYDRAFKEHDWEEYEGPKIVTAVKKERGH